LTDSGEELLLGQEMSDMACCVLFGTQQRIGGIAMKTREIKKSKPAAKKAVKTGDPLKDRTKPKDENVCTQSEAVVTERICCCEEVCC
jgi:hypothetical protein